MSDKGEAHMYFSSNVVPKFRTRLDEANYQSILGSGFEDLKKEGVALELTDLQDPYKIVVFPKTSPSRPYEMMMTVLPQREGIPARSSLADFSEIDAQSILHSSEKIAQELYNTATEDGITVKSGYIFQHYNPRDLRPKTSFNGSVEHLHLHVQMYGGDSLDKFPHAFVPSGTLSDYEGANRLTSDSGVPLFHEIMGQKFPSLDIILENQGCVSFGEKKSGERISTDEVATMRDILITWDTVWDEVSGCYVSPDPENPADARLLPVEERVANVHEFLQKNPLSDKSRRVLLFLAEHVKPESEDVWRNFYNGPNGAVGLHHDYEEGTRKWLIAPRIFRSWSRHLPLIMTQSDPVTEWTTKNESGDGIVNVSAKEEIFAVQKRVVEKLKSPNLK